jgi:hypothetical protein
MHGTWRAEESKAQMPVGEAGGANGDVEAEANWPRDRSETLSVVSASRKRKAPCVGGALEEEEELMASSARAMPLPRTGWWCAFGGRRPAGASEVRGRGLETNWKKDCVGKICD